MRRAFGRLLATLFGVVGSALEIGWAIIVGAWSMGPDLALQWVRTNGVNHWRLGLIAIRRLVGWWILITAIIGALNIVWWHSTGVWTALSPITIIFTAFLLIWATPIAFLWSATRAFIEFPALLSLKPNDVMSWLTKLPSGWWERTTQHANRWIHAAIWILLGEIITFTYLHIFQVWKFPAAIPLLMHAVVALILLDQLRTKEERILHQGRSIRPLLTSINVSIVMFCTASFIFPKFAAALRDKLGRLDEILTIGDVLPIAIFLAFAVPLVIFTVRDSEGKVIERPYRWAKWITIMLPILYFEYLGVKTGILAWSLPVVLTSAVAAVLFSLVLLGFGMMFPSDSEHRGIWALGGHVVVTMTVVAMVMYVGSEQRTHYFNPHANAVSSDGRKATVDNPISDVKVCPIDREEFRGLKTKDDFCTKHGAKLVWLEKLVPAVQDSIRTEPNNPDFPEVNLASIVSGGDINKTSLNYDDLIKGRRGK